MVTRVTRSEMSSFKVKIKPFLWLFVGHSLITRWLLVTIKHFQSLLLNKSGVLPRKNLLGHVHSSQFMEWLNLGITTLKHATCSPNVL